MVTHRLRALLLLASSTAACTGADGMNGANGSDGMDGSIVQTGVEPAGANCENGGTKLEIIAHTKTRALMAGPALRFNQPGLDEQLPGHITDVEQALAKSRSDQADSAHVKRLEAHLALDRAFLAQKRGMTPTLPTRTYDDSLTIRLGEREIRVLHHDRAITPGDTYLWLPKEDVVVTGDAMGFYRLVVDRDPDAVEVTGSRTALLELLAALPERVVRPAAEPGLAA